MGTSVFYICFENSDHPVFRPFTPIWTLVTVQQYSKSSKQNAPNVTPHWRFKSSGIWIGKWGVLGESAACLLGLKGPRRDEDGGSMLLWKVTVYQLIQHCIQEDLNLRHCSENLKILHFFTLLFTLSSCASNYLHTHIFRRGSTILPQDSRTAHYFTLLEHAFLSGQFHTCWLISWASVSLTCALKV